MGVSFALLRVNFAIIAKAVCYFRISSANHTTKSMRIEGSRRSLEHFFLTSAILCSLNLIFQNPPIEAG
jgi:hypothetical protein